MGHIGLEQLVDHSIFSPTAVLTKYAGKDHLADLIYDHQIGSVPVSHYVQLLLTFRNMQELKLSFDEAPTNVIYAPSVGFTVIDYMRSQEKKQSLEAKVLYFAGYDMLASELKRGAKVPKHLVLYREACVKVFDNRLAVAVDKQWHKQGLIT